MLDDGSTPKGGTCTFALLRKWKMADSQFSLRKAICPSPYLQSMSRCLGACLSRWCHYASRMAGTQLQDHQAQGPNKALEWHTGFCLTASSMTSRCAG